MDSTQRQAQVTTQMEALVAAAFFLPSDRDRWRIPRLDFTRIFILLFSFSSFFFFFFFFHSHCSYGPPQTSRSPACFTHSKAMSFCFGARGRVVWTCLSRSGFHKHFAFFHCNSMSSTTRNGRIGRISYWLSSTLDYYLDDKSEVVLEQCRSVVLARLESEAAATTNSSQQSEAVVERAAAERACRCRSRQIKTVDRDDGRSAASRRRRCERNNTR